MTVTSLDYTPLTSSVTRKDVAAFRRAASGSISPGVSTGSKLILTVLIIAGVFTLSTLLSVSSRLFSGGSTTFVLLATMLVAAGVFTVYRLAFGQAHWARLLRLSRFAQANGLSLTANGLVPGYPGVIFGIGSERRVPERLTRITDPVVDFGNLNYTTGSGKNRTVHRWGYLAIKLDRMLPNMVLDAKSNNFFGSNLPKKFSRNQVLTLEGDFDKYFTLYCPQEYERDALYVFTPDLMARLIDEAALFDVEIVDDWMLLYSARPFDLLHAATLARLFRIVDTVGNKTVHRTQRYADDRTLAPVVMPDGALPLGSRMASNTVARQGRRLQSSFPIAGVVIIVVGVAVWLLNILPMFSRG